MKQDFRCEITRQSLKPSKAQPPPCRPLRGTLPNGRHHTNPKARCNLMQRAFLISRSHDDSTTDDTTVSLHALARGHRDRRRQQVHALCLGRCGQVPEARTIPRWQHCRLGFHRSGHMDECSGRRTQWYAGPSRMSLAVTMAVTALTAPEIPIALQSLAGIIREPSAHHCFNRKGLGNAMFPGLLRIGLQRRGARRRSAVPVRATAMSPGSHCAR